MSAILMASTLVGCGQTADNTSASVAVQNEVYAAATTNGVETVSQKIPKYIFFIKEFPMTGSGKIQKFKLKDLGLQLCKEQGIEIV